MTFTTAARLRGTKQGSALSPPDAPQAPAPHLSQEARPRSGAWALALIASCALTACAPQPQSGFSFATRGEQLSAQRGQNQSSQPVRAHPKTQSQQQSQTQFTRTRFAGGRVTLVAPRGHCIDTTLLRHEADGGFALLPRCNLLHGPRLFGRNRAAVITASIGPAQGAGVPSSTDLARTAAGAKLLYYDDKGPLALVRLHSQGHSAMGGSGASAEHWRGAFVVNDMLVVLALYAPEGSTLLGQAGARVLTEMTRRSQQASLPATSRAAPEAATSPTAQQDAAAQRAAAELALRPKARPAPVANAGSVTGSVATSPASGQKLALRKRIGGLFRSPPTARLTTE